MQVPRIVTSDHSSHPTQLYAALESDLVWETLHLFSHCTFKKSFVHVLTSFIFQCIVLPCFSATVL